ncbi:hypothetical protein ACF0H5_021953 [Mactra antiquata]
MSVTLWAFLLVTVALVNSSEGLKCYSCLGDDKCNDPFSTSGAKTETCSGSCQKIKGESSGVQAVARSCSLAKEKDGCIEGKDSSVKGTVCYCNTDLCNTGNTQLISLPLTIAIGAFITLMKFVMTH